MMKNSQYNIDLAILAHLTWQSKSISECICLDSLDASITDASITDATK